MKLLLIVISLLLSLGVHATPESEALQIMSPKDGTYLMVGRDNGYVDLHIQVMPDEFKTRPVLLSYYLDNSLIKTESVTGDVHSTIHVPNVRELRIPRTYTFQVKVIDPVAEQLVQSNVVRVHLKTMP